MGLRDLLRIPETHRRTRSETRSEIIFESIEGRTDVGLTLPRLMGSAPDLGVAPLAGSSAAHIPESKGV